MRLILLGFVLLQLPLSQGIVYPPEWQALHDSAGWIMITEMERIRVFEKSLDISPVPAIRVDMITGADPKMLLEIIWAVDKYPKNLPSAHVVDAGFINRFDYSHQIAWQVIDTPFLAPRMYQFDHIRNPNRIDWVKSKSVYPVPGYEDLIIPLVSFGSWEIVTDDSLTTLIYRACTDPGGSVPSWLVDRASQRYIPYMLLEVEKIALDPGE